MRILKIEINRFRNYYQEMIEFDQGVNIFFGNNGQGKTNILEAIYMLSLGRSFRTNKDKDMISLGSETAYVRAIVESQGREYKIEYRIDSKTKKAIKINGVPISKITELLGIVNVVIFSPEDLSLVKDGPKERRNFIDRELSQLRPRYYLLLNNYYKSLTQRNNILKEKNVDEILLEVYDEQLAANGVEIIKYRQEFVNKISKIAMDNHEKISSGKEELFLKYNTIIMVGGSMMYEKAVIKGLNDLPEANEDNQNRLNEIWKNDGIEGLQNLLKSLDEPYYNIVDKNNPRRLLRAIDIIWQTKKKYSELISEPKNNRFFKTIRIGIEAPRETIYERINQRVEKMIKQGLINEVKALMPHRDLVALQTVGYTEIFKYLDNEWSLDFAISEIKKNSRRFAKRQLTWYDKRR